MSTEDVVFFDGKAYSHQIEYELHIDNDNDQYYLDSVTVKEKNTKNKLFVILRDLMEQNFAVGQIHSFLGRPYEIVEYNESTRTLLVSRNNKDVLFYKPHLTISIGNNRSPIKGMNRMDNPPKEWRHRLTGQPLSIAFDGFETEVSVQTHEWFEFTKYTVSGYEKTKTQQKPRKYKNGKVLKVSLRFLRKPEYLIRIDDIRKSLQLLLYEAMPSIFPHHSQYLIISSIDMTDRDTPEPLPWIFNLLDIEDATEDGVLTYYFTEDAHIDLGLLGAISRKDTFLYILSKIYDYLMWLCEGHEDNPDNYDEYRYKKNIDKLAFLKYGTNALPPYLDIDLMINFIKDFFENDKDLTGNVYTRQKERDFIGTCDFCRSKMKNSKMQRLDDGRMRCPDCSKDAIDTEDQFEDLCGKVKAAFLTHLGIDFNTIPHKARFVSAVELHKMKGVEFSITNGYDVRKLLGFARITTGGKESFFVENGYKPDQTFGIIAHEMTHIWEYQDESFLKVSKTNEDLAEGLAVWTDLFLSRKNGATNIEERKAHWLARTDEYGRGLRFIMEKCPDNPYDYIRTKASEL